jgi:hypothetical protein
MKCIATFIGTVFSTMVMAQPKDLATLPTYDCALKKVMVIIGSQTILVSPDKSIGLDPILDEYCGILGANCIRKKESALTDNDLTKTLFIVGVLSDFKKWALYKTPIRLIGKGFMINSKSFQDKADGFAFVDTNRIIVSGNSLSAVKVVQLALTGGHDLLITQKGKITFFGNRQHQKIDWFNLQNLKTTHYTKRESKLFSAIYISKTFKDSIDYAMLNHSLRQYTRQFLAVYNIKMPTKKIEWLIHSNMQEYGTVSGMFGLTCPGNSSAGFSIRGEIHTNGYNVGLVKHEYSHYLFDNTIKQDNNPAFFVEGCVEYVTNINDSTLFRKRVETAKKFKDTLNYADLIIYNKDFYGQYSETNYSVCGIFVKYIIDQFGVDNFKKYCLANNKKATTKELFKIEFDEMVTQYKSWLSNQ